ncbi:hypothetical protein SAMN04488038_10785 [Solimonas aquatica]|uniref:Uncharacterized protein n=1 Tax=Solimonas aquatica TaxID=489703 RepID=A0A1H9GI88_9GAMM|nr:hypothetical protein [Solimonas aquatica]SEQ49802.1 hypothetical protein SAMN04488038_10785 [Solimonas aquatica]
MPNYRLNSALDPDVAAAVAALDADAREYFEERAAIIEFDGGVQRIDAERRALALTRAWLARRRGPSITG